MGVSTRKPHRSRMEATWRLWPPRHFMQATHAANTQASLREAYPRAYGAAGQSWEHDMENTAKENKTARQVPAHAQAMVHLLNSRPHAVPALPDKLDDTQQAGEILEAYGLTKGQQLPPNQLDRIRALRTNLLRIVEATDDTEQASGWEAVSTHDNNVTFRLTLTTEGPRLNQATGDPLIGQIISNAADLLKDGTWSRIRVCNNNQCRGIFYDNTRSRTQRWHSYEQCGNRTNVAAYRARKNTPHNTNTP
jgi:predicted RNA-binding Zn ribbon-like protein